MRLTHFTTEFGWNYLASRLRTTDPEKLKLIYVVLQTPEVLGANWVKKRYVDSGTPNESRGGRWINTKVYSC